MQRKFSPITPPGCLSPASGFDPVLNRPMLWCFSFLDGPLGLFLGQGRDYITALQRKMRKIRNKFSRKRNCAATISISTFMCLWATYIFPRSICLFFCMEICLPILEIDKSFTDTWKWKLGLRPRNSQKRNCAAKAFCYCPAIISHRPRSQNILKEQALNPEKDSRIKRPR